MKRAGRFLLLVVSVLAVVWAAAASEENVWVSSDGQTHAIHGHGHMMLLDESEGLDLSELADGETRVLGSGDSAVTVSRSGDVATITREATEGHEAIEIRCELDRDTCKILTSANDPERVAIMVRKERTCTNGEGDCDQEVWLEGATGGEKRIVIRKEIDCDNGDCAEIVGTGSGQVMRIEALAGEGAGEHVVFVGTSAGDPSDVILLQQSDKALLRCPEGDATLSVTKDEAEQVFLCPKHSVPLERVASPVGVRKIVRPHAEHSH